MDHISRIEIPVGKGFIHVYSCKLAGTPHIAEYSMVLSEDELARADSYRNASDSIRYISSHLFLRNILSRYTGTSAGSIRFLPAHYYKRPLLSSGEVEFSLSYRGEWALLAVSSHIIGADIEQHREIDNIDDFATDFFSEKERHWLSLADTAEAKHRGFFKQWTLKEAYIKAISKGISFSLTQFSILPDAAGNLLLEAPFDKAGEWKFKTIEVAPGYAAAVAYIIS